MYYEGLFDANERSVTICVAERRSAECMTDWFLLAKERGKWSYWDGETPPDEDHREKREAEYRARHLKLEISREDAEELWERILSTR